VHGPAFKSDEILEVFKVEDCGISLMRENGVALRERFTWQLLKSSDYKLIAENNKTGRKCQLCGNDIRKNDDIATEHLCGFCAIANQKEDA